MERMRNWLDRLVEQLCERLETFLPRGHVLAYAGERMGGLRPELILPLDRRLPPTPMAMADVANPYGPKGMMAKANKASTKKGNADELACGFWAYCHISGQPCQRCKPAAMKSINSLVPGGKGERDLNKLCGMVGKKGGAQWFGCCEDLMGVPRLIAFADCCSDPPGPQNCGGTSASWCHEWPDAKNWCYTGGGVSNGTYYCTIAVDVGGEATCK